jgi:uncharacterized protein (TIGR02271 family)
MQSDNSIEWDGIIKKEARGSNDEDLGEVQEIGDTYVLTQKGMLQKQKFYIPKYLAEGYDGSVLRFRVSEEEAKNSFVRDSPPSGGEYSKYKNTNTPRDIETRIPVIEERLNVSKSQSTEEATITKRPVTETKTVDVRVTHEELSVERRPPSDRRYTSISAESPVDSQTEIKVPLKKEELEVSKEPYVKEVVVKKKPVTETHQVSEHLKSEEINEGSAVATEEKEE